MLHIHNLPNSALQTLPRMASCPSPAYSSHSSVSSHSLFITQLRVSFPGYHFILYPARGGLMISLKQDHQMDSNRVQLVFLKEKKCWLQKRDPKDTHLQRKGSRTAIARRLSPLWRETLQNKASRMTAWSWTYAVSQSVRKKFSV